MAESHTIMRYLADSRNCDAHWYPRDLQKRALVDMYLDQHHTYLRSGVGGFIFKSIFSPKMFGKSYGAKEIEFHKIMLKRSLRLIENRLTETRYLCGDEKTIADLSAACELDQTRYIDLSLDAYPKTKAWLHNMIDESPEVLEFHKQHRKFAAMSIANEKKKAAAATAKAAPKL